MTGDIKALLVKNVEARQRIYDNVVDGRFIPKNDPRYWDLCAEAEIKLNDAKIRLYEWEMNR